MVAVAILDFQKFEILTVDPLQRSSVRHYFKSHQNRQTIAELWRFNSFFSKLWPSAILVLLVAYWDHPRRPLDGLYRCAKFG